MPHDPRAADRGVPTCLDDLRRDVAELLNRSSGTVDDDEDLLRVGLDSIQVIRLASRWRRAGADVLVRQLFESRTIAEWWRVLSRTALATPSPEPVADEPVTDEPFDLAPMQLAYWIGRSDGQPLGGVGAHFYAEFDGRGVEPERLEGAVRAVQSRHPMLRALFRDDGTQQILPESRWAGLVVHELADATPEDIEAKLTALRDELSHRRLAVDRGELFDVVLSRLPDGATRVHVEIEMLVADAHSFRVVLADLARAYVDPQRPMAPLSYSFPQYLKERAAAGDATRERAQEHWQRRLPDLPAGPQLPLAVDPARIATPRVTRRYRWLSAEQVVRLAQHASWHGLTLPQVFLTAFAAILGQWSAQPRFLLNLPLYDRQQLNPEVDQLVGDFTNLLLLEIDTGGAISFADLADRVRSRWFADVAHTEYSGVDVLRDIAKHRKDIPAGAPVVFTSAIGLGELFGPDVRRQFGTPGWTTSQTPQVWLDHQVTERENGLFLNWDAIDGLFCPGVVDAMFDAYSRLIDRLLADESEWTTALTTALPPTQAAVRERVNATAGPRAHHGLHEAFFAMAQRRPDAPALLADGRTLTYRQLADRALALAAWLVQCGLTPGEPVAVTLPRGFDQVIAVLGALAAGGAYVPVGLDQPDQRRDRILAVAGARFALTGRTERTWPDHVRCLDVNAVDAAEPLCEPVPADPERVAYVLFTSGSTGQPKGVDVPHRAAVNTIDDLNERFAVGEGDLALALSAVDFDLSVYDMFGMLSAGAAVLLVPDDDRRDPDTWAKLAARHRVTVVNCVPTLLDAMLTAAPNGLPSLRLVLLGGDWVGLDLPGRVARVAPGCRFVALGGTTETAIHSTVQEVTDVPAHWRSIPYGTPLRNVRCHVVDDAERDRPDWVPGELWIGGDGVALGYRGDPDRTADRFRDRDGRWYRTGDLARYWPDGTLEFLGRADHQVKIRGNRVELGEVEAAIRSHPSVVHTAAAAFGTPARLGAVVVERQDAAAGDLRSFLAQRLPIAMLPEVVVAVDEIPLSANGKVDRRAVALRLGESGQRRAPFEPPRTEVERTVAAVWGDLLGGADIGRLDDFFERGGDSLLATRLLGRLRSAGVRDATLSLLFSRPVLADFAAVLRLDDSETGEQDQARLVADLAARHHPFPPTDVQRAYWLGRTTDFALGGVGSHWYWEFDGDSVDLPRLERCWNLLVDRHEMLRAVFDADGRQRVLAEVSRSHIPVVDAPDGGEEALRELRDSLSHRVPDPSTWPLVDIRAVRYGDRTRVAFSFDYIVLDALSIVTVFAELSALYRDPETVLPPITMSFRDYVVSVRPTQAELAAARQFWEARLDELPPAPQLPLHTDPERLIRPRFTRLAADLAPRQWANITARAREHGVTPAAVLAAAYAEVLGTWSADRRLTMNLTLFDRREVHPDINRVVGDFTSLLLVESRPVARESWLDVVRRIQAEMWAGMEHRAMSAIDVLRMLSRRRASRTETMPVVFTSALGLSDELSELEPPFGELVWGVSQTPQVWLDNQVMQRRGGLSVNWDAVADLFPSGVLDAMFDAYVRLLSWTAEGDWTRRPPDLLPASQRQVRAEVNDTAGPQSGHLLHEGFMTWAARQPEAVALMWGEHGTMTYGTLADRARRLAAALVERGVQAGDPIAVTASSGPEQIVAVFGILFAGGCYVPVGSDQPRARRERICRNAGVRLVLTTEQDRTALSWPAGVDLLAVDTTSGTAPLKEPVAVAEESLVYVIYTSGSSGEPKGVEITHKAAVNTCDDVSDRFGIGAGDRVLAVSSLDFDLSVYDVFGLLGAGGAVVLVEQDARREARRWAELVRHWQVTVWNSVPALLDMLLTVGETEDLGTSLRLCLVSGDWVGLDLRPRLDRQSPGTRLVALGGATEAAIWSNAMQVDDVPAHWRSVPYGFPLRNQRFRVVDDRDRDRPDWVRGELWIGGAGLARGYRGEADRTADRFVGHGGERWYRTGDLGRYWPDGTLEFLGRDDFQVKIRGHRIELGEVEAALESSDDVARAVAVVTDGQTRRLSAVLVPARPELDPDTVRTYVAERLPAAMVPDRLVVVDRLPLTANAKVDRSATAALVRDGGEGGEPIRDPLESQIAERLSKVLGVQVTDRHTGFFALGGDSVLATRLVTDLRRSYGVDLSLRQLFQANTVAGLAAVVAADAGAAVGDSVEEGVL